MHSIIACNALSLFIKNTLIDVSDRLKSIILVLRKSYFVKEENNVTL